jgi:putative acetyltransferase
MQARLAPACLTHARLTHAGLAQGSILGQVARMPVILQPMRAADLPAIQALWVAAWSATLPEIDFAARRDWLATHLAELHAAGASTLCATEGATEGAAIAGFLTWLPENGLIEQLAAHPARFGAGIGSALLAAVKQQRPAGLHLLVNQENPRAVAFYQREGFAIAGATTNPGGARPLWRMRWPA